MMVGSDDVIDAGSGSGFGSGSGCGFRFWFGIKAFPEPRQLIRTLDRRDRLGVGPSMEAGRLPNYLKDTILMARGRAR
jgi:hypothetical protein